MVSSPLPVKWAVFLFGLVAFPVFLGGLVWPCPLLPTVGWGLWSFWMAPPRLCGAVCSTEVVWLQALVVMSSLRARYPTGRPFRLQMARLSLF